MNAKLDDTYLDELSANPEYEEPVSEEQEEQAEEDTSEGQEIEEQDEREDSASDTIKEDTKLVSYGALHEERERRRELEGRVREMDERLKKYDTIEQKLEEFRQQKEEAEKEPVPDFNFDPTGNLDARMREMQETIKLQNEQLAGVQSQTREQQALAQLGQAINRSEAAFSEKTPDYFDALTHVRNVERAKIEPLAKIRGATEDQIQQHLYAQELQAAAQLIQLGQDPAEYAYNLAKAYGYAPKEATEDEAQDLRNLEKGQKASRTLGSGGTPSKKDIDDMPMDEFDVVISELFGGS